MKKLTVALFVLLFVFATPIKAARDLFISGDKSSITGDDELQITASASGFLNDETIYIKGAFYKDGSTNYFGLTKFGDNWIKNSAPTQDQYSIKFGDWNNKLDVKSDFLDSGFSGSGDYKFKIGFYYLTGGGKPSSVNWSSNTIAISIIAPSPTPTQSPYPKSPAPTISRTSNPTPVKFATIAPINTSSISPTPQQTVPKNNINNTDKNTDTADLVTMPSQSLQPVSTESSVLGASDSNKFVTTIIIFGLGIIFIATSIYMAINKVKESSNPKDD